MRRFLALLLTLLCGSSSAPAQSVVYQSGFEDPPFAVGSELQGQDGWTPSSSLPPFLSTGAAKISSADAKSGVQSVAVEGKAMTSAAEVAPYDAVGSFRRPVGYDTTVTGQTLLRLSVDAKVTGPGSVPYTAFAGSLAARDNAGFTLAELELGPDGSVAGFGDQAPGSAPAVSGVAAAGAWHELAIEVDYLAKASTFFVDGAQVGLPVSFAGSGPSGVLARGALVAYAGPNVPGGFDRSNHAIYFDNFSITAVPEPTALALAALGGALSIGLFIGRARHKDLSHACSAAVTPASPGRSRLGRSS